MTRIYKSSAYDELRRIMENLNPDQNTDTIALANDMDHYCPPKPTTFSPDEIKSIRLKEKVSQGVFARYLNVSKNLISDWERGQKRPGGPAMRLLTLVKKNGLGLLLN